MDLGDSGGFFQSNPTVTAYSHCAGSLLSQLRGRKKHANLFAYFWVPAKPFRLQLLHPSSSFRVSIINSWGTLSHDTCLYNINSQESLRPQDSVQLREYGHG